MGSKFPAPGNFLPPRQHVAHLNVTDCNKSTLHVYMSWARIKSDIMYTVKHHL